MGWLGTPRELTHYLNTIGADHDDEGRFLIYRKGITVGIGGADLVVPDETEYSVDGRRYNLAAGLATTSYGMAVKVF